MNDFIEVLKNDSDTIEEVSGGFKIGRFHPDVKGLLSGGCLHHIYPPLAEEKIFALSEDISKAFPSSLTDFYRLSNGLRMFCGSFSFKGSLDCVGAQPISLWYGNIIELPRNECRESIFDKDHIYIGSYSNDSSVIKINCSSGVIFLERCGYWGVCEKRWDSLEDFLWSEHARMKEYYDSVDGKISALEVIPSPLG